MNKVKRKNLVEIETPCGVTLIFNSFSHLRNFLDIERDSWSWIRETTFSNKDLILREMESAFGEIESWIEDDLRKNAAQITDALRNAFINRRIPVSSSHIGINILDNAEKNREEAVLQLAAWMIPRTLNLNDYSHLKAAVITVATDLRLHVKSAASIRRSLEGLAAEFARSRSEAEDEAEAQRKRFALAEAKRERTFLVYQKLVARAALRFRNQKNFEVESAVRSIRETESLHKEQMRLQVPVEYWTQKAKDHKETAAAYRWNLLLFSIFGSLSIILALALIIRYSATNLNSAVHSFIYVPLATLGIVVTTIGFWVARILTRLFLSEHHLSIDAEERAVMAKTYLALAAVDKVGEEERRLVLASLFRPTADGIVKDDAAPDLSPAAVASKILAR